MINIVSVSERFRREWKANARLKWGVLLIAGVLCVEGSLRWTEAIMQKQHQLAKLQSQVDGLTSSLRDESAMALAVQNASDARETLKRRLWIVPSEAVGQARLKDWLTQVVKKSIADQYAITLGAAREVSAVGDAPVADPVSSGAATGGLKELRATLTFKFTPQALEGVLSEIEAGEPVAAVDALLVKAQERRVELTLRVLVQIKASEHD